MGPAVAADPVGYRHRAVIEPAHSEGAVVHIHPAHPALGQIGGRAQVEAAAGADPGPQVLAHIDAAGPAGGLAVGDRAVQLVGRVPGLAGQRSEDLPVGGAGVGQGRGQVTADLGVQGGQGVVGHGREHVVLDVVVHVRVQEPEDGVHVHGAGVEPVVQHVLSEPGVLGEPEEHHQPEAVHAGQADVEQRHRRPSRQGPGARPDQHRRERPGLPHHPAPVRAGDEVLDIAVEPAGRVPENPHRLGRRRPQPQEGGGQHPPAGGPGEGDLGVAAHHDGVGVMAGVGPAPQGRLPQHHEGGQVVDGVVEPSGPESGAVAHLVPAGVGRPSVQGPVGGEGRDGPPRAQSQPGQGAGSGQQTQPQEGVDRGPAVGADGELVQAVGVDGGPVPLGLDQAPGRGPLGFGPADAVVPAVGDGSGLGHGDSPVSVTAAAGRIRGRGGRARPRL